MVDVNYRKKKLFSIRHIWFSSKNLQSSADITFYHGITKELADTINKKKHIEQQYSLTTDLNQSEDLLWKQIRKNVRYEIRRSEKENIMVKHFAPNNINKELLDEFEKVYNQMYRDKAMKIKFNRKLIECYIKNKSIEFSIGFIEGLPTVFHSYIVDDVSVRFFYSTSPFRQDEKEASLIARVNRHLHWNDICYFKKSGYSKYDWGGITNPRLPNGIDNFKIGFGGKQIVYYNLQVYSGLFGTLYALYKNAFSCNFLQK